MFMFGFRPALPLHVFENSWTLNRQFFCEIEQDDEHIAKVEAAMSQVVSPANNKPGILIRYAAKHLPQRFDPFNGEHVAAWQKFVRDHKAMPITFILEDGFSCVPAMIQYRMSTYIGKSHIERINLGSMGLAA